MTEPMLIVLGILAGAVALWSWGRPRADIVAVLIVLGLMVSGVLTPQESLAGFGDPVVILIAAVFVVGAALENTGIRTRPASRRSESRTTRRNCAPGGSALRFVRRAG